MKEEKQKHWDNIKNRVQENKFTKKNWKTLNKILSEDEPQQTKKKYMYNENGDKLTESIDIAEAFKERQESIFQPNTSNNITEDKRRKLWYDHTQFHKRTTSGPYDLIFGIPPRASK